jgi:hypothetical protein
MRLFLRQRNRQATKRNKGARGKGGSLLPQFPYMIKELILFLGASAKLREPTISFVMSDRLSASPSGWGVHEISYLSIFRKSVEKIQLSLKSDKNNGYFYTKTSFILQSVLRQARSLFQSKFSTESDLVLPLSFSSIFSFP